MGSTVIGIGYMLVGWLLLSLNARADKEIARKKAVASKAKAKTGPKKEIRIHVDKK